MKSFIRTTLMLGVALAAAGAAQAQIAVGDSLEVKYFFPDLGSEYETSGVFSYAGAGQAIATQGGVSTVFLYDTKIKFSETPGCGAGCSQSGASWNGAVVYDYTNGMAFAGWGLQSDTVGITGTLLTNDHIGVNWQNAAVHGAAVLGVPEPASWALMLGGFGLVGSAMRSSRRKTAISFG